VKSVSIGVDYGRLRRFALPTVALAASGSTTLGFNLVLARTLSPAQYGEIARGFAVSMAVAQLTMASIAPALARVVAGAADDHRRFELAPSAIKILAGTAGFVSCLYVPLAFVGFVPEGATLFFGGLLLAGVYATYFGIKMILFALDRVRTYARLEFLSDALFFVLLAMLVIWQPQAALFSLGGAYLVFVLLGWRYVSSRTRRRKRIGLDRAIARYSALALVSTYASVMRFPAVVAVAGLMATSAVSAEIALVVGLVMPLFLIPHAAGAVTFAEVARDNEAEPHGLRATVHLIALLSSSVCVLIALFAEPILALIGGVAYESAASAFAIVLLCLVPHLMAIPIGNASAARGAIAVNAAISTAGLLIVVVGTVIAAPEYGAIGAAVALGIGLAVSGSAIVVYGFYAFGLRLSDVSGALVITAAGVLATTVPGELAVSALIVVLGVVAAFTLARVSNRRLRQVAS
jgi:O-antigen/teichoic acid export membrane protein